jgi:Protein of unknown function (DUF2716)
MRYRHFDPPRNRADFDRIERHWLSLDWHPIKDIALMDTIRDAWTARFGNYGRSGGDPAFPSPSLTWDLTPLAHVVDKVEEIEAELTMKMLAAFRRCVPLGERLLAIEHWQHNWYEFDPHGGISAATRDEWALPILPDGDSYHFVAKDLSFGVSADRRGTLTVFGGEVFAALESDPPEHFLRLCRARPVARA